MPSFPTLLVQDIEASSRWYQEALGFQHIFTIPGHDAVPVVVHLRWSKYADVLLRREIPPHAGQTKGVGVNLSLRSSWAGWTRSPPARDSTGASWRASRKTSRGTRAISAFAIPTDSC